MDGPRGDIQSMRFKPLARMLFEPQDLSSGITERGHDKINVTIAIEITRLNIGHPPHTFQQDVRVIAALGLFQPDDPADVAVVGGKIPQHGDHKILIAVTIQIDEGGMRGSDQIGSQCHRFPLVVFPLEITNDPIAAGITHQQIEAAILIQIDALDVGDPSWCF